MKTIWVDAHLSPAIVVLDNEYFEVTAVALRDLGLSNTEDPEIFVADAAAGKLDCLITRTEADIASGNVRDLDGVLRDA